MQETQVQSLSWEDTLEGEMATHSNILAWRIPWTEEPGGLQSMGSQRVRHNLMTEQSPARGHAASYAASGVRSLFDQKLYLFSEDPPQARTSQESHLPSVFEPREG